MLDSLEFDVLAHHTRCYTEKFQAHLGHAMMGLTDGIVPDTLASDIPLSQSQERRLVIAEVMSLKEWLDDPDRCRECPLIAIK